MSTTRAVPAPSVSAQAGAVGGPRLLVVDVLRGVAIVAMLVAHAVPFLPQLSGAVGFAMSSLNDVASPLFALVMGMSAQLVVRRTDRSQRGRMLFQQVVRGALLVALGLWMGEWGSWVAVILSYLGVLLVVGTPVLLLASRWVAAVAVAVLLLSAPLNGWARSELLWAYGDPDAAASRVVTWLVLGQQYRVMNLLPFFLLGALLLRHGLRRDAVLWTMLAVAPVAYAVSPVLQRLQPSAEVRSGTYADTLHDVGLVVLVYVVVIVAATTRSRRVGRVVAPVLTLVGAEGAVALSLYVLHVGVLALWAPDGVRPESNDYLGWLVVVPGMLTVGFLWWRLVGTGPVEWVMGLLTGRRRPLRRRAA